MFTDGGWPTYAIIPFKDEIEMTIHVADLCLQEDQIKYILFYDNGSSAESVDELLDWIFDSTGTGRWGEKEFHYFSTPDLSIYEMWNAGWDFALENENNGNSNLVFLNNDIDFWPGTVSKMVEWLRRQGDGAIVYPNYDRPKSARVDDGQQVMLTHGTKKDGGMCGHMFAIRAEFKLFNWPQFDPQFEWWCGDDDFARNVEEWGGSQYRLMGWGVDHVNEGTAGNGDNDWTHEAKERDIERLVAKWGYF